MERSVDRTQDPLRKKTIARSGNAREVVGNGRPRVPVRKDAIAPLGNAGEVVGNGRPQEPVRIDAIAPSGSVGKDVGNGRAQEPLRKDAIAPSGNAGEGAGIDRTQESLRKEAIAPSRIAAEGGGIGRARLPTQNPLRKTVGAKGGNLTNRRRLFSSIPRPFKRLLACVVATFFVMSVIAGFILYRSYNYYAALVDGRLANGYLTSRSGTYAAPKVIRTGQTSSVEDLTAHLRRAGYVESNDSKVWSGSFIVDNDRVEIRPTHSDLVATPAVLNIQLDKRHHISELTGDGVDLDQFTLEPEVLTNDATMKTGNRTALGYDDIPQVLVHAILSTEDHRFFEHPGVDVAGIVRAAIRNAGESHVAQGGSTITQQLVKNTYLSPERTFRRKYAEAMLAFVLERRMSKKDILALYCSEIYLGQRRAAGVRGVDQAARIYFGKPVADLTLPEAALIAGMIQSPSRYSPDHHPQAAIDRRATVLAGMVRDGAISLQDAEQASKSPLGVVAPNANDDSLAPYFVDYVNRNIDDVAGAQGVDGRGLRVFTTVDLDLQKMAEEAIAKQLDRLSKTVKDGAQLQGALVALNPANGDILAMVGGHSYAESQLNRATDSLRQPGSVFKPVVYSAALESGMTPLGIYRDAPQVFHYDQKATYQPVNYGGGFSMQDVTMRTALIKSLNVVTVDVAMRAGLKRVASTAVNLGLPAPEPYPSMALGTTEVSPLQIAAAYSAFANQGLRVEPRLISRVANGQSSVLDENPARTNQAITPATAYMITDILSGVIDHGTAKSARGLIKDTAVAGKTGTSRDGWFVGYTPNLVVAVWIGFDDNRQLGLTGAEAALPAWTDFVGRAVAERPTLGGRAFERPEGISFVDIDPETGLRASDGCPQTERVALKTEWVPGGGCFKHIREFQPVANEGNKTAPPLPRDIRPQGEPESPVVAQMRRPAESSGAASTRRDRTALGASILVNEIRIR